jgi:hypothetical protein
MGGQGTYRPSPTVVVGRCPSLYTEERGLRASTSHGVNRTGTKLTFPREVPDNDLPLLFHTSVVAASVAVRRRRGGILASDENKGRGGGIV